MRSFEYSRKIVNGNLVKVPVGDGAYGFEKAYRNAKLPEYQTLKSACADFYCAEEVVIPSIWKNVSPIMALNALKDSVDISELQDMLKVKPTLVHTGIKANMEENEVLEIYNRSSNPMKLGLVLANSVGIIDADYYENEANDGEIMFAYYNFSSEDVVMKVGDRVGQGMFKAYLRPTLGLRVKEEIRKGGFGSTGK